MKRLIAAALALSMFGGTAAQAAPYFHRDRHPSRHVAVQAPRHHMWARGQHFRPAFGRPVVVNDWGHYRLRRPPVGYHWVRYDNDFLLVALAGGLIADIALANAYGY
jgi:Ni/Co efflux regulator RcnB